MSALVLGKSGQVARALADVTGFQAEFLDRSAADLNRPESLRAIVLSRRPTIVINTAAYTAVDLAESNSEEAFRVNAEAPGVLASACEELGIPFVHFSTDYVYSGEGARAWVETDKIAPLSVYGKSKIAGDEAVLQACRRSLIFRTSWVYADQGKNFLTTMLKLGAERESLKIVSDQVGAPTYAPDLARAVHHAVKQASAEGFVDWGVYHYANSGETSWHGFALAIFEEARRLGLPLRVRDIEAIPSAAYPTPAQRPRNSRLNTEKFSRVFTLRPPTWQQSLSISLRKKKSEEK